MVHYVAYVSTATELFSQEQLWQMLSTFRRHNTDAGITGAMLYHDGTILQIIEGSGPVVAQLMGRINADPRHHSIEPLIEGDTDERQFGDWSMAFRDYTADAEDAAQGFSDLVNRRPEGNELSATVGHRLLRAFRRTLSAPRA